MEAKTYRFLFGLNGSKKIRNIHLVALTISLITLCANILMLIYAFEYNLYLAYAILISVCLLGIMLSFREMYLDWKHDDYNLISSLCCIFNFITTSFAIMAFSFLNMIANIPLS